MDEVQSYSRSHRCNLALLAVVALAVVGCAEATPSENVGASRSTTSSAVLDPSSTLITSAQVELEPNDLGSNLFAPAAMITSTGVPVAVIDVVGDRSLIRTPCGAIIFVSGGNFLSDVSVVIDPGHGGPVATGAVGPNGLVESHLNLRVTEAAIAELTLRGIGAVSTRSADYATTLPVRAAFADGLQAEVLISIHHNAPTAFASEIPGTEVFVQSDARNSARLGGLLQFYVVEALGRFDGVRWTAAGDAGVLEVINSDGLDAYGIIRRPETPSVILEMGYISNPDEADLFTSSAYIEAAAIAIAAATEAYLTTERDETSALGQARIFNPAVAPSAEHCEDPILE